MHSYPSYGVEGLVWFKCVGSGRGDGSSNGPQCLWSIIVSNWGRSWLLAGRTDQYQGYGCNIWESAWVPLSFSSSPGISIIWSNTKAGNV